MKVLIVLLVIAALVGGGLWLAVRRNGPAVVDAVDNIVGARSGVTMVESARFGDHPAQKLRVYRPEGARADGKLPIFVFIHGGGWAHGDPDDYGFIARNIAPEGYLVVLPGYRLGEEGRYPRMIEDAASALAWVRANAARLGGDPDRLLLAGHSAGAYNVVAPVLDTRWLDRAGVPLAAIKGVVGLSGPYDFYPYTTPRSKLSFGSANAGPDSQPVNNVRADAPPLLLVHGTADTVVRVRNSRNLAAAMREVGGRVELLEMPGAEHNAPLLALVSPWRRDPLVFDTVRDFLARSAAARTVSAAAATGALSAPVQPPSP